MPKIVLFKCEKRELKCKNQTWIIKEKGFYLWFKELLDYFNSSQDLDFYNMDPLNPWISNGIGASETQINNQGLCSYYSLRLWKSHILILFVYVDLSDYLNLSRDMEFDNIDLMESWVSNGIGVSDTRIDNQGWCLFCFEINENFFY